MATITETQDLLDELTGMTRCSHEELNVWT